MSTRTNVSQRNPHGGPHDRLSQAKRVHPPLAIPSQQGERSCNLISGACSADPPNSRTPFTCFTTT